MSDPETINKMEETDSSSKTTKRIVKFSHSWTIENYSFFQSEKVIESPTFGAESDPKTRWFLMLYPKGNKDENKDYISLYLALHSSELSEVHGSVVFHLRGAVGQLGGKSSDEVRIFKPKEPNSAWGRSKFIKRVKKNESYLADDKLTLRCEVSYAMQTESFAIQNPKSRAPRDRASVPNEMYRTRKHFDVVLSLDGKEFRAHKAVLGARSLYLESLFELDNIEGKTSQIEVSDMNESTLEDLLRFMYTGEAEVPENMNNLLATIDKHLVADDSQTGYTNSLAVIEPIV